MSFISLVGALRMCAGRHQAAGLARALPGGLLRLVGGVRFGRGGAIEAGLDDRQFALGAAEELVGVLGGEALDQRLRIGEADVLDRGAHQAAQHEQRLLARDQHPRQVIQRGLRVRAAQRFVQRRDEVVVPFAVLVVDRDPALEEVAERGRIERLGDPGGVERFGLVEQEAPVAVGAGDQRLARLGRERQGAFERLGACRADWPSAAASSRWRISTCARLSSAALSSKLGFSVVAPTSVTVPRSTKGRKPSCCARLKRWISSTNSSVRWPACRGLVGLGEGLLEVGDAR